MTTNRKIAKASLILMFTSLIGHTISLAKEMLVASRFGLGIGMDAFYAAIAIPNFINNVFLSTFYLVLIPVYVKYRNSEESSRFISVVINYLFLLLVCISLSVFLFSPWIITHVFSGLSIEPRYLSINILRIVCLSVVFSGIVGILTSIFNADENFAYPAASQMFVSVTIIAAVFFFSKYFGILVLAYGLVAGIMIQTLFLIVVFWQKDYRYHFDLNLKHPAIKHIASLASSLLFIVVISQLNPVIDRIMASYLDLGSISALGYAEKLVQVPLLILSGSIATAVFPYFSTQVSDNRIDELSNSVTKSIRMSGFIFIPLTVMAVIVANPVIRLLFARGAFTDAAADLTSTIFICYSFQFLFYTLSLIFARVFLALKKLTPFLFITVIGLILKIALNLILMKSFYPPAAGIALSTSLVLFFTCALYVFSMKKKTVNLDWQPIFSTLGIVCLISAVMGVAAYAVFAVLGGIFKPVSFIERSVHIFVVIAAGASAFIFMANKLKFEELYVLYASVTGRQRS